MSASESDRVIAAGIPITLLDAREVRVRYGFRGLKMLEDSFGSIGAVQIAVSTVGKGKTFGPIAELLAAGLVAEGVSADQLLDLLDPGLLSTYVDAIGDALEEAFPPPSEKEAAGKAPMTKDSRGQPSTTAPPSDLVAATPRSGT